MNVLGGFWYHILQHNNIKKYLSMVSTTNSNKISPVSVPSFKLTVDITEVDCESGGCLDIWRRGIRIRPDVSTKLRSTIVLHELMEWANSFYGLNLPHNIIQAYAEYMVYIVTNNNFLS